MKLKILVALILMASGRAMTLPFIARAGGHEAGDPPAAWLMPLMGDAAIGVFAIVLLFLIWKAAKPWTWVVAVVWSAIGAFDALAAFTLERTAPWPEFFMLEIFGPSMFFAATLMHIGIIVLLAQPRVLAYFGIAPMGPLKTASLRA